MDNNLSISFKFSQPVTSETQHCQPTSSLPSDDLCSGFCVRLETNQWLHKCLGFIFLSEEEKQEDSTDAPVTSIPVSSAIPTASTGLDTHTISSTKTLNYRSVNKRPLHKGLDTYYNNDIVSWHSTL